MLAPLKADVREVDCRLARCFDSECAICRDSWIHVTEGLKALALPHFNCAVDDRPYFPILFPIDHVKEALDMLCGCAGVPSKDFHLSKTKVVGCHLGFIRDQSFSALIFILCDYDKCLAIKGFLRGTTGLEVVCIA